jgi:hypothetical protein
MTLPVNHNIFDEIDSPAKAYWLGVLYTDGNVSKDGKYVNFECMDLDWVEKFKEFLQSEHKIQHIFRQKLTNSYTYKLSIGSTYMNTTLRKYGLVPNKTYDHSQEIFLPKGGLEPHFWRGCIDGDGCLAYWPNSGVSTMTLVNKNISLLNLCKKFFNDSGYIQRFNKKGSIYYAWVAGTKNPAKLTILLNKLYANCKFEERLERKYNKYNEIKTVAIATLTSKIEELEYTKNLVYNKTIDL